jgi:hypothetical protein
MTVTIRRTDFDAAGLRAVAARSKGPCLPSTIPKDERLLIAVATPKRPIRLRPDRAIALGPSGLASTSAAGGWSGHAGGTSRTAAFHPIRR